MPKRLANILFLLTLIILLSGMSGSKGMQILGIDFPGEKNVAGKVLKLNGAAGKKALGTVKLFARGFYLESPTHDAVEAIESEQVKHFSMHYLTGKITAGRLQKSFTRAMEKSNPPELVKTHRKDIDTFASWLDKKTYPGMTSSGTYEPGK
ncbi:MAG: chalcone isomerase family protein, partial [Deltaproteobacteria bacterium]|nr:chalcone isomerase family protein [Deltaproteobacteria bacterium]